MNFTVKTELTKFCYREGISLHELQAPPSRPKGREQRVPVVVNACMEQPIKGHETEPFLP